LKKLNPENENIQDLVEVYRNHYPLLISPYQDTKEVFKKLKKNFKIIKILF